MNSFGFCMNRRNVLAGLAALAAAPRIALAQGESPVVATSGGTVRGLITTNGIASYRGIPYGAPTGGANRFMPPRHAVPWTGVFDATVFGPSAPQGPPNRPPDPGRDVRTGEDCLVVNVWTPAPTRSARRPVMVWLHGGGFITGSATPALYDGANLARLGDVVVVSLNHRLNAFGYTYLGGVGGADFADSGNVGQLDIVQALGWVRDNIEAFGGDPSRVTIFGESGGGLKTAALLATPPAARLFHRAIIESGPGIRMASLEDQDRVARELMMELSFAKNDMKALQTVPAADLHKAFGVVNARHPPRGAGFISIFAPTIDGRSLPHHPFDPSAPTVSSTVPLMIGSNHTEATLFGVARDKYDVTEAEIGPLLKGLVGPDVDDVVAGYRKALPNASPWDLMILINTDIPTSAFSREIARRKTEAGGAPAWLYRFDWETPVGRMRAPHTIEMPFVFSNLDHSYVPLGDGPERPALAHTMSTLWTNFARGGKPIAAGIPTWPPYDGKSRSTMLLNTQARLVNDPDQPLREISDKVLGFPA